MALVEELIEDDVIEPLLEACGAVDAAAEESELEGTLVGDVLVAFAGPIEAGALKFLQASHSFEHDEECVQLEGPGLVVRFTRSGDADAIEVESPRGKSVGSLGRVLHGLELGSGDVSTVEGAAGLVERHLGALERAFSLVNYRETIGKLSG